jgi:hypothetical protein
LSSAPEDVTIEGAAERALMREFIAVELAERLRVPVEWVVTGANEWSAFKQEPVDDILRAWFGKLCT